MAINKYNKYNVWRRYKSYDSGKTWVAMDDYEAYQTEENVEACGYIPVTYRWVAVDGTMCNTDTHTLYSRTRQQASYDRGQTWDWTEPAVYNYGDVIEENSPQCGYPIYQWVTVEGATMCGTDEATKYNQYGVEKEQVSTDNGVTWTDTGKQREGKMIENLSLKCGYVPQWKWEFTSISCGYKVPSNAQSAITRVAESTEYCENVRKYSRQNIELSTDNGATWSKTDEYKTTLLESASTDCGYAEQWVTIDGEYVCGDGDSRYNKYHKEKKKVSYDSGVTWTDTDETRAGGVIQTASTDCGYDESLSLTVVTYTDGTVKYFDVEGVLGKDSLNTSDKSTIKKVIVGSKVTSFGWQAFQGSSNLTTIELPDTLTSIGDFTFNGCSKLESIVIPNGVTEIGINTFSYCSSLTGVTIPNSVKKIRDNAFLQCTSLTSIVIPNGVISIEDAAFNYCLNLKSVTIPDSVKNIGKNAFYNCRMLTGITIPSGVTSISNYTFGSCFSLTSIALPNTITSIGEWAFEGCTSLTSATIGNSVTCIGSYAFAACKFTNITIPSTITSIGDYAFTWCNNLTEINVKATTPPILGNNVVPTNSSNIPISTIYVPSSSVDAYKSADGWKVYADRIQAIPS